MLLWTSAVVLAFAVALPLLTGHGPERQGGLVLLTMTIIAFGGSGLFGRVYRTVDPVGLIVDVVGFVGFTILALRAPRYWPLWASSLQLLSLIAHLVRFLEFKIAPVTYAVMKTGPSYLLMMCLIVGSLWRLRFSQTSRAKPR
jgi:hypothetical protein